MYKVQKVVILSLIFSLLIPLSASASDFLVVSEDGSTAIGRETDGTLYSYGVKNGVWVKNGILELPKDISIYKIELWDDGSRVCIYTTNDLHTSYDLCRTFKGSERWTVIAWSAPVTPIAH